MENFKDCTGETYHAKYCEVNPAELSLPSMAEDDEYCNEKNWDVDDEFCNSDCFSCGDHCKKFGIEDGRDERAVFKESE